MIKRKRVRETKEVREYGHSIIEKKKKKLNEKYLYTERRMEYRRKKKQKQEATEKREKEVEMVISERCRES